MHGDGRRGSGRRAVERAARRMAMATETIESGRVKVALWRGIGSYVRRRATLVGRRCVKRQGT